MESGSPENHKHYGEKKKKKKTKNPPNLIQNLYLIQKQKWLKGWGIKKDILLIRKLIY